MPTRITGATIASIVAVVTALSIGADVAAHSNTALGFLSYLNLCYGGYG